MIFDIIRASLVDGPGIRTTVFFKGCNLRCAWCHNPESQSFEKQMMFYQSKCTGCGKCKEVCPLHFEKCDFCGKCALICPRDARKICGREMTADEIMTEIVKDKTFFANSGGGVTFSGGECMLQIGLLKRLLQACKEQGIHTAVDTAGYVPWENFEEILPYCDLFLFDIKAINKETHLRYTGVPNDLILENFRRLCRSNANIMVRVPVIGGVNDTEDEMLGIRDFLTSCGHYKTELLPYHAMGEHKYAALGRACTSFNTPSKEQMQRFRSFFEV